MSRRSHLLLCLLTLLAAIWFASFQYGKRVSEYSSDQFLMDTLVSIKVYGNNPENLKMAVAEAYAEMRRIAELSDAFPQPGTASFKNSDVCRINAQAGKEPVKVDSDIMAMLLLAKKYSELSGGAFDVTVGPLMELWDFGGKTPHVPRPDRIHTALALVSNSNLILDEGRQTAFLGKRGMKIDLGAVAKGYATEKALQVLKNHGIHNALIDAGGNIRMLGRNRHDAPWRIGIKDPGKSSATVATLQLEDTSAVTSGNYYRFFESGGRRYHHILDPRTGYPANRNMSATVVTKDAGLADVLSTVFFILPAEAALEMAEEMTGVELFLVTANGRIRHSPGLRGRIEVTPGEKYDYDQGR